MKKNLFSTAARRSERISNNRGRHRRGALVSGAFLLSLLLAASLSTVDGACEQWNAGGQWSIQQRNRATIVMNLRQNGTSVTGTATHTNALHREDEFAIPGFESFGTDVKVDGRVTGTMEGDVFYVEISWSGGKLIGAYRGKVSPAGRIQGTTYDIAKPSTKARWFSTDAMKCPDANPIKPSSVLKPAPPSASPTPKVIKTTGRGPVLTPTPATTSAAAPATISASPQVVRLSPGQEK